MKKHTESQSFHLSGNVFSRLFNFYRKETWIIIIAGVGFAQVLMHGFLIAQIITRA